MNLSEWADLLEPVEKAYVSHCFRYWNGTNGGIPPSPPPGMSKARADILLYHTKSLNNGETGKRKMEQSIPVSFRWLGKFKNDLLSEAAQLNLDLSTYVFRCINIGRPVVKTYPDLCKQL